MLGRYFTRTGESETDDDTGSNLPGPRYLFTPASAVGQLMAHVLPVIPYVNLGTSGILNRKYQGTPVSSGKGNVSEPRSRADFAGAGQDAIALVSRLLCAVR